MKKLAATIGFTALVATGLPAFAQSAPAPESPHTFSANVTLASEYRFRGIMQTNRKPALQGGFDYAHASGFYIGNWNSTISWLSDGNSEISSALEMDFYAGYKGQIADNVSYDVGVLQYYYPGSYPAGFNKADTTELYASVGYGPVALKYSHAVTDTFGFNDSRNSYYVELNGNFDTGFWGLTVNTHIGYQKIKNVTDASYTDWKIGLTKDLGAGFSGALAYVDTNAKKAVYTNAFGRYTGKAAVVATLTKTF